MTPKIETVEKPQIGEFYLVPCIELKMCGESQRYWPIIGPWHEDADIGVHQHHFHHDVRFWTARQLKYQTSFRHTRTVERCLGKVLAPFRNDGGNPPPIFLKRRKMRRDMPDFPIFPEWGDSFVQTMLEPKFKNVRMKCMTCPHRGMSLTGLPIAPDGTVVCNGHGLKWNIKTGEMVPR